MKNQFLRATIITGYCLLAVTAGWSQTNLTIGTATSTANIFGPTTSTTAGARIERHTALYTATELSAAGLVAGSPLLSIAWNKTDTGSYAGNDLTVNIYLKDTNLTTFTANPSYAALTSTAKLVYTTTSGSIPATTGFITFIFNAGGFSWSGTGSILVITEIVRSTSYTNTSFDWSTLVSVANTAANANGTTAPTTLTRTGTRPQVRLEMGTSGIDAALTAMPNPVSAPLGAQNISVVIRNVGTTTLTSATIGCKINNSTINSFAWSGSLALGASTQVIINSAVFGIEMHRLVATISNPNGMADLVPANDTVSKIIQICNTLSGSYTINNLAVTAGTNFNSFTDFANALANCGVNGNVVARVDGNSGPYTEQVVFQNIAGIGPSATVTIKGNNRTITSDTAILNGVGNPNPNRHIIRLIGLQYFTIDSLKINMVAGSSNFIGIQALNSGNHLTISNCTVDMGAGTSTLLAAFAFNGTTTGILTPGGTFNDINVTGNSVTGGGYGVSVIGLASPLAKGVTISKNTLNDFNDNGVYLRETDSAVVNGNHFHKGAGTVAIANAINFAQTGNINGRAFNNDIKISQANGSMRGIYLFAGTGHKVFNNVIINAGSTSGTLTGIEVRSSASAPEIAYNTISFDFAGTSSGNLSGIKEELSNTNAILRNNIISISQPSTGIRSALVLGATATVTSAFNSNYNVLYVPDGNIAIRNTTTPTFYNSLAAWQAASGQDANSLAVNPLFFSQTLLIPTNPLVNNKGIAVAGITTDIIGITRGTPPDPGAYEMNSTPTVYTFTGVGNWNITSNWSNNAIPSSPLPAGSEIIINPINGSCILNVPYTIGPGGKLTVKSLKNFVVQGNLTIQ